MSMPEQLSTFGARMKTALSSICEAVIQAAPELDALDAKYVPPFGVCLQFSDLFNPERQTLKSLR